MLRSCLRIDENPAFVGLDGGGGRINVAGLLNLRRELRDSVGGEQERGIPVVSLDEVRVEFQGAFVFAVRPFGIPIPVEAGERQRVWAPGEVSSSSTALWAAAAHGDKPLPRA